MPAYKSPKPGTVVEVKEVRMFGIRLRSSIRVIKGEVDVNDHMGTFGTPGVYQWRPVSRRWASGAPEYAGNWETIWGWAPGDLPPKELEESKRTA